MEKRTIFTDLNYWYGLLTESKDHLIDKLPKFNDEQKEEFKKFLKRHPERERDFNWNVPSSIEYSDFKNLYDEYPDPIDPDTVKEFSDKRSEPVLRGYVTTYQVEDTIDGMMAVRRVVDTHWGKDANPWCLISRRAEPEMYEPDELECDGMEGAWEFWERYSLKPKRIAFKDGKLLAFMATPGNPYPENELELAEVFSYIDCEKLFPQQYKEYFYGNGEKRRKYHSFATFMDEEYTSLVDSLFDGNKVKPECVIDVWWDRNDRSYQTLSRLCM